MRKEISLHVHFLNGEVKVDSLFAHFSSHLKRWFIRMNNRKYYVHLDEKNRATLNICDTCLKVAANKKNLRNEDEWFCAYCEVEKREEIDQVVLDAQSGNDFKKTGGFFVYRLGDVVGAKSLEALHPFKKREKRAVIMKVCHFREGRWSEETGGKYLERKR